MRKRFTSLSVLSLFMMGGLAYAQVSGVLRDSNNFPMEEAEVIVTRTGESAYTDGQGNFNVDAKVGDTLKIIDSSGEEKIVKVTSTSLGVVKFTTKASENIELGTVNLIGGIKMDAAQKVGAYDIIKKEDFELAPTASIDEVLNGRVAGLVFSTNSGDPGSTNIITIRGVGSLIGTPNPLYVIDGIPIGKGSDNAGIMESWNPIASIDPNMIESVAVLKDASATALYGARGANGVIVITTKKGKYNQKTRFNFSTDKGVQSIAFDKQKFLTAAEYVKWGAMATLNGNSNYAKDLDEAIINFGKDVGWDGVTDTKWRDAVQRNQSTVETYNFSATGGSENTSFRIGGSYYDNKSLVLNSKFNRISINSALEHKLSDKLNLGLNLNYTNVRRTSISDGGAYRNPWTTQFSILPIYPIYNTDGTYNQTNLGSGNDNFNPVALQNMDFIKGNIQTYLASINAEYKLVDNLYYYTLFGAQNQVLKEKEYWDPSIGDGKAQELDPGVDPDFIDGLPGGIVTVANTSVFDWNWQNSLSYRNKFADKHDLQVWAGVEYQEHEYNQNWSRVVNLLRPEPYLTFGGNYKRNSAGEDLYKWTQISYFGRTNYTFDNKYTFSGQLRKDSNSTLGTNEKSGIFWSLAGSWNIGKESFMANNSVLTNLVLKANYGEIGNIPYADNWGSQYNAMTVMSLDTEGYAATNPTYGIGRVGNDDLKWEVSKQWNIGLEFELFKAVNFTIDVYDKRTVDAIWLSTVLPTNGNPGSFYDNIGEISNKGIEVTLNANPINKQFKWNIYGNFAYNKNRVESLYVDRPQAVERISGNGIRGISVGRQFGEYYVPLWAGVDSETGEGMWWTDGTKTATTKNRKEAKSEWLGKSGFPIYTASLKNDFTYKGFTLSVFFTGQFDYYVHNMWQNFILSDGILGTNQVQSALYDVWTPDNKNASNPKPIVGHSKETQLLSDRWVRKGDHIRLKEVKLGYKFNDLFKSSTGLDNLTIYMKGVNLWLYRFDKKLDFDPESNSNAYGGAAGKGLYDFTSPIMKSISFGVSLDF